MAERSFYAKSARYWANIPATIDGVLGGYGYISDIDINGSKAFLEKVFAQQNPETKRALDCGAGIGRVSKHLLIPRFDKVDLVEQDEKFINTAKLFVGEHVAKVTTFQESLQNFQFQHNYDIIWCQWVLGNLDDYDLIAFLNKSKYALSPNGVIIIKENIASKDLEFDDDDSSVTRPLHLMMNIFIETKLKVILTDIQTGFPEDIYPVHSFALVPVIPNNKATTDFHNTTGDCIKLIY